MRLQKSKQAILFLFAVAIAATGCAAGSSGGGGGGGNPNRLTAEDLVNEQEVDAYTAIQRLRPRWLQRRASAYASVFIDGTEAPGGLNELRTIRVNMIGEIRYMSASDATTRYGTGHDGGAILVTLKRE